MPCALCLVPCALRLAPFSPLHRLPVSSCSPALVYRPHLVCLWGQGPLGLNGLDAHHVPSSGWCAECKRSLPCTSLALATPFSALNLSFRSFQPVLQLHCIPTSTHSPDSLSFICLHIRLCVHSLDVCFMGDVSSGFWSWCGSKTGWGTARHARSGQIGGWESGWQCSESSIAR